MALECEEITPLGQLTLPYGKEATLQTVRYEGGLTLLRVRIREGKRFTIFDIDAANVQQLADLLKQWSDLG